MTELLGWNYDANLGCPGVRLLTQINRPRRGVRGLIHVKPGCQWISILREALNG
jgi:hypothetical protein